MAGTDYSHLYLYDSKGNVLWSKETGSEVLKTCISSNGDYLGYLTSRYADFHFALKIHGCFGRIHLIHSRYGLIWHKLLILFQSESHQTKLIFTINLGKKVWGFVNEKSRIGVMASGGGNVILGNKGGVFNYSLEPYLKKIVTKLSEEHHQSFEQNLDTSLAKKTAEASKNFFKL